MAPRHYKMTGRAASAAETRRRIVEATAAVHFRKGIAGTTYRDIAEAADIGIGTIYHHFPTYLDVVEACGAHTLATAGIPDGQIYQGRTGAADRLDALVSALFAFYERNPWISRIRAERDQFETVRQHFEEMDAHLGELIRTALAPGKASRASIATLQAILDFSVWERLTENGLSTSAAAEEITTVVKQYAGRLGSGAKRRKAPRKGNRK